VISKYESQFFAIETGSDVQADIISGRTINRDIYAHVDSKILKLTNDFKHWDFYLSPLPVEFVYPTGPSRYALRFSDAVLFFEEGDFSNPFFFGEGYLGSIASNGTLVLATARIVNNYWIYQITSEGNFVPLIDLGTIGNYENIRFFEGAFWLSGNPPLVSTNGFDWQGIESLPESYVEFEPESDTFFAYDDNFLYKKEKNGNWTFVSDQIQSYYPIYQWRDGFFVRKIDEKTYLTFDFLEFFEVPLSPDSRLIVLGDNVFEVSTVFNGEPIGLKYYRQMKIGLDQWNLWPNINIQGLLSSYCF
ncbi:MAG: hypothetical protein KDC71_17085, partial [Acidobacteria bacterium]|nr:hypothetical protein [Acidobacteriota bacterium]